MSKLQLRKVLSGMDRDQIEQILLDAYTARKEIKEYFDYFANPDVDKLEEKYQGVILKEISRHKRGWSKCRISVIKKQLKEFASFQPGVDKEIDLMIFILEKILSAEKYVYFTDSQFQQYSLLLDQLLVFADTNLMLEQTLSRVLALLRDATSGTKHFRTFLLKAIEQE